MRHDYPSPDNSLSLTYFRDRRQVLRSLVQDGLYKPEDILVLTPRRLLGYAFRDVLQANDIRVHSFFHEEVLESAPAQRAFALLNLVAHPDDRVALRWWLGSGSHDGLAGEYHNLRLYCQDNGVPPKQALETIANGDVQVSGVSKLMPKYEDLCRRLSELEDLPLADLIDFVLPEEEEGLEELRDIALISSADADSVQNFFNRMKTYITQPEMPEANDFVRVMSLHKSKGLTCKVVIVLGCVQGLIPGEDREDTTDEERMATLREQR